MNHSKYRTGIFTKFTLAVVFCVWLSILIWSSFSAYRIRKLIKRDSSCGCLRHSFYPSENRKRLNSTCSDPGTFYKHQQNVVSFALHLSRPVDPKLWSLFVPRISQNLERMRKFYPTFSMRLYTDEELTKGSEYCKLWCENPDLFWCDVRRSPSLGNISNKFYMLWRFTPLGDPTVDVFLSRDLDSFVNFREASAVKDWLKQDKALHAMRDHPLHTTYVLGGMWGGRNSLLLKSEAIQLQGRLLRTSAAHKGLDQGMLAYVLMPRSGDVLVHDSYLCSKYNFGHVRPFPTKRGKSMYDYVGSLIFNPEEYNQTEGSDALPPCPVECRPSYGKDWEYC